MRRKRTLNKKNAIFISFGAMALLYFIGFIDDIDYLTFDISKSKTEIAFLPIVVGLVLAFICDLILNKSQKQNS